MKTIYVVLGSSGEYSDRMEWLIKAYNSEEAAQEHVTAADTRFREWEATKPEHLYKIPPNWMGNLDPNCFSDYAGNHYWYTKTELEE